MNRPILGVLAILCLAAFPGITALAQEVPPGGEEVQDGPITDATLAAVGPVTSLPLPRFVSMKAEESNVRRGPSLTHRIDWVFKRRDMPLEITAEYGHWRRVRDHDGMGGWVHYSLISGNRTVLVDGEGADLHMRPDARSQVVARLEQGVIARLDDCTEAWCRLSVAGYRGWTLKSGLWGVGADEIRD